MLSRLGRNSFWSPVFVIPVILIFTLPRIPDLFRLGGNPWLWLAASAIALAVLFGFLAVIQLVFLKRLLASGRHPFVNVAVMGVIGLARGANYGFMTSVFGLFETPNYAWMLPISAVVVIVLGILTFQTAGAMAENRELTEDLVAKREELLASQAELTAEADGEQARLRQDALAAISPRVASLTEMLSEPRADREQVASELASLVGTTLREHLNHVWLPAKPAREIRPAKLTLKDFGVLPKFRLRRQLEPTPIAGLIYLTAFTSMWQWAGWFGLLVMLMIMSAYWVIAKLVMAFIPHDFVIRSWVGLPLIVAFPAIILSPAEQVALAFLGPNANGERTLSYMTIFVAILSLTLAANRHLDFALERFRGELHEVNAALERDLAITRRRIWLMRRNWHLKLHGEFQGALTAILARLSTHPSSAIDSALVRSELDLALTALESEAMKPKPLGKTLRELSDTWRDVVRLKIGFSAQVETLLDDDDEARQCVAELIREAVNNASKHGKATELSLTLDRPNSDLITITAINNGLLVDDRTRGMGTQFYSDLCLNWSLENLPDASGVILHAEIPVRVGRSSGLGKHAGAKPAARLTTAAGVEPEVRSAARLSR
jgi:hypothetical protein